MKKIYRIYILNCWTELDHFWGTHSVYSTKEEAVKMIKELRLCDDFAQVRLEEKLLDTYVEVKGY